MTGTSGPAEQDKLYPLEFFVCGTPMSLQAGRVSKERWKDAVRQAAKKRIDETDDFGFLDRRPLSVIIYYFSAAAMEGDLDNIVKPILDGLILTAYLDDEDVERVVAQKFEPQVDWGFSAPSAQLARALMALPPVVYLRVDDDLSWRDL